MYEDYQGSTDEELIDRLRSPGREADHRITLWTSIRICAQKSQIHVYPGSRQ